MLAPRRTRVLLGAMIAAAVAAASAVSLAAPSQAVEQSTLENPPIAGPGVCPESGLIGQIYTGARASLTSYGFWVEPAESPAGQTLSATVTWGSWSAGQLTPFATQDVSFTVPAERSLVTLAPVNPLPMLPIALALRFDFRDAGSCPVRFALGADYADGSLLLGTEPAPGDLAFSFGLGPVDEQPGPYVPPGFSGSPPPGVVGVEYSYQFTLVGNRGPRIEAQDFHTPGLQIDSSGLIFGTPTQAGTFDSIVRITDGTITNARHVTIVVAEAPPPGPYVPPALVGAAPGGVFGQPYSYRFQLVGSANPYIASVEYVQFPGLQIDATGRISGTPTGIGTYTAVVALEDDTGATVTHVVTLLISGAVDATPPGPTPPAGVPSTTTTTSAHVTLRSTGRTLPATGTEAWPVLLAFGAVLAGAALLAGRRRVHPTSRASAVQRSTR